MAGPDRDAFSTLLSPTVRNDTASFVASHYQFALSSNHSAFSLQSRFLVKVIGLNKAGMPVQHESLAIWVFDKVTLKHHEFIIDRVPSDQSCASRFSAFIHFPASDTVLESIQKAIHNMRSITSQAATSLFAAIKTETESLPLLPLTNDPHSSNSTTPFTSHSHINVPQLSLTDKVTLSLSKAVAAVRTGSQSISPQSLAYDSISGRPPNTVIVGDCIRRFEPVELSLFDVGLLAQVVHDFAPIYGLFDNQCYMFASVMFDAIVQLYSLHPSALNQDPTITNPNPTIANTPVPAPTPEVGSPQNANIIFLPEPDQAGRWSGLLILDPIVKATIVSIVVSKFRTERAVYMAAIMAGGGHQLHS